MTTTAFPPLHGFAIDRLEYASGKHEYGFRSGGTQEGHYDGYEPTLFAVDYAIAAHIALQSLATSTT